MVAWTPTQTVRNLDTATACARHDPPRTPHIGAESLVVVSGSQNHDNKSLINARGCRAGRGTVGGGGGGGARGSVGWAAVTTTPVTITFAELTTMRVGGP